MKTLALALLLTLSFGSPARASNDPTTLDYALSADVDSLDPHWSYDAVSLFVVHQVYETLIDFKGDALDAYEPRIATVVPSLTNGFLSKDGLTYAFPLRSGVRFHDGTQMTADDVKYSLMRFLLLDRDGGPSNLLLQGLLGVRGHERAPARPDLRPGRQGRVHRGRRLGPAAEEALRAPARHSRRLRATSCPRRRSSPTAAGTDARRPGSSTETPPRKARRFISGMNGTGPSSSRLWDRAAKKVSFGPQRRVLAQARDARPRRLSVVAESRERRRRHRDGRERRRSVERGLLDQFEGLPA